jgi:hypothetical protein
MFLSLDIQILMLGLYVMWHTRVIYHSGIYLQPGYLLVVSRYLWVRMRTAATGCKFQCIDS